MKISFHITCGPLEGEEHTFKVDDAQRSFHSLLLPGGDLYNIGVNYGFHDQMEFRFGGAVLPPCATVGSIVSPSSDPASTPRVYLVRARQQQPQPHHDHPPIISPQPPPPSAFACPICLEPTPPDALVRLLGCSCAACQHCAFASMLSAFRTSDATILKCQMPECVKNHGLGGRTLEGDEIRQFLSLYARKHALLGSEHSINPAVCSCGAAFNGALNHHSRSCDFKLPARMQRHQEHVLNMVFFHKCKGHVVCPCGANQMIHPAHTDSPTPIPCPKCSESFCSCCKRKPFHYNLPCDRVEEVRAGYLEWQSVRRGAVLQHLELLDSRFKTEQRSRSQKVQEELDRLQQLRGVMCCPHCNHPCGEIQDVRCGKFICGRLETDSAASAVAGGCGREFKWEDARPFKADLPASLKEPLRREIPRWTRADGQALLCDCCGNVVEGALLQCVGCNGLNICIRCDASGYEHVRHGSQQPCHNDSHYCIIHMRPDSQQSAFPAVPDGDFAHSDRAQEAATTAHVFREDCSKTTLRSRPTTGRSESVMVVPKVQ